MPRQSKDHSLLRLYAFHCASYDKRQKVQIVRVVPCTNLVLIFAARIGSRRHCNTGQCLVGRRDALALRIRYAKSIPWFNRHLHRDFK